MKTMKKALAILMVCVLMMSMMVTVSADDAKGTITINNAEANAEYHAYKLLDLSYENHGTTSTADDGYVYYLPANTEYADWYDFLTGAGIKDKYIHIDSHNIVTWIGDEDAEKFAEKALKYAEDNKLTAISTETATASTVTLPADGPGYYLVDSAVGALVVLTTAIPDVTINEKNDAPTIEKKVKEVAEDGTVSWEDLNRVEAGDEIEYRIIINVKAGAKNYVLHDKIDAKHLAVKENSLKIYLNDDGNKLAINQVAEANYTATQASCNKEGCGLEIKFTDEYLKNLDADDVLTVYYSAYFEGTVDAVTDAPHTNIAWLTYGDGQTTVEDQVETVSYGIEVLKYANNNVSLRLGGAEFELYRTRSAEGEYKDQVYVHLVESADENAAGNAIYTVCNHPEKHSAENEKAQLTMETPEGTGTFILYGVDLETYYLVETKAPAGYNPLTEGVEVVLDINHMQADRIFDVNVNNNTGTVLPGTGGSGTTVFYVAGALLVMGAVVMLITKKRMGVEK